MTQAEIEAKLQYQGEQLSRLFKQQQRQRKVGMASLLLAVACFVGDWISRRLSYPSGDFFISIAWSLVFLGYALQVPKRNRELVS